VSYLKLDTADGPTLIAVHAIVAIKRSGNQVCVDAGRWTYVQACPDIMAAMITFERLTDECFGEALVLMEKE